VAIVWGSIWELALAGILCSALFWGTAGYAISTAAGQRSWVGITVGAVFAPMGLIGLGIAAGVARGRRHAKAVRTAAVESAEADPAAPKVPTERRAARRWGSRRARLLAVAFTLVSGFLLLASVAVPWVVLRTGVIPALVLVPIGTGFDLVIYIAAGCILVAAGFILWRPFRWAAVLVAWVADWWLFAVLSGLILQNALSSALAGLRLSLGDLLNDFGLGRSTGLIGSSSSGSGLSINLRGVDLTAPLRNAGVDLGPAWIVLLAFVVLANVAIFVALRYRPPAEP
jgi:hypothetical protein